MYTVNDDEAERIVRVIDQRRQLQSPLIRQMQEVQRRYDGNIVAIPLPDVEGNPTLPKTTPLLIANAIDDAALGAASTIPNIFVPPVDPSKAKGKGSKEMARIHRRALDATGRESGLTIQMRRAFRQLAGYATWSQVVLPCPDHGVRIELRDPLASYPDPKAPEDCSPPNDIAYLFLKSAAWVRSYHPEARMENGGPIPPPGQQNEFTQQWVMFEWWDGEKTCIGILGPNHWTVDQAENNMQGHPWMILSSDENRLGYAPAIIPRRASMSGIAAQIAQLTGTADLMDKLMALDIVAQEKSVFPDKYVISQDGRNARILNGSWKDGRTGEMNILVDVQTVGELKSQPDQRTQILIDRLERNFRTSAGGVPQQRGETFGALRTGRAMDTMFGISVDPKVQEMHEIAEQSLSYMYKAATDTYLAYFPNRSFSKLAGRQADVSKVEFIPAKHFEHSDIAVSYAIPGANAEQLTVALGMMVQAELIGPETARKLHPYVYDPEGEATDITINALRQAMLEGVIRGVATSTEPGMSPALKHAARIMAKVRDGEDLDEAIESAWEEVQEEQAELLQQQPGLPPDPAAMPGLAGLPIPGGGIMPPGLGPAAPTPPPQEGIGQLLGAMGAPPPQPQVA